MYETQLDDLQNRWFITGHPSYIWGMYPIALEYTLKLMKSYLKKIQKRYPAWYISETAHDIVTGMIMKYLNKDTEKKKGSDTLWRCKRFSTYLTGAVKNHVHYYHPWRKNQKVFEKIINNIV